MALMISIYEVMSGMTFRAHSLIIFISNKYIVAIYLLEMLIQRINQLLITSTEIELIMKYQIYAGFHQKKFTK